MQEIKLINKYAEKFLSEKEINDAAPKGVEALKTLHGKTGAGNDFLGWLTLPTDYDKEEFEIRYLQGDSSKGAQIRESISETQKTIRSLNSAYQP